MWNLARLCLVCVKEQEVAVSRLRVNLHLPLVGSAQLANLYLFLFRAASVTSQLFFIHFAVLT